uniref:Palmitoyltransferase n=1 Tax=Sus scrofa TaxID=9823 RepID=A0A8D0PFE6_PIG
MRPLSGGGSPPVLPEAQPTEEKMVVPPLMSRVNGWSKPLHKFQVACWVVFLILTSTNFGIFIPLMPPYWRYTAYGVTGSIFLFHLVVHIIAVSINPAEKSVHQKNYLEPMPVFDRSKHAHVIQDLYCHLCETNVDPKTKHCSACNKCVLGFDHHCKWLNNCVGRKNYRYFFSSVVSALAGLLCMFAILSYLFVQFLVDPMQLRTDPHFAGISRDTWLLFLPFLPVRAKAPVLLLIGLLVLVIIMIGLLLLGHLFFFHLYLSTCPEPRSASAEPCPVFAWSPGRQAGPAQSPETPEHGGQITGRGETPWGAAGPGSVPRRAENLEESHKVP